MEPEEGRAAQQQAQQPQCGHQNLVLLRSSAACIRRGGGDQLGAADAAKGAADGHHGCSARAAENGREGGDQSGFPGDLTRDCGWVQSAYQDAQESQC